jgi:TRAP-type C4-dicarboxylate transport system permease small subunit
MTAAPPLAMLFFAAAMCYFAVINFTRNASTEVTRSEIITHSKAYGLALLTGTVAAFLIHSKEVRDLS